MPDANHVLVIEDDPSIRQVLVEVLRDEGYAVQAVHDGREALDHLAAATPSLLVLDVALPHVDGLAICRWVRRNPRLSRIPVLMISAYSQPSVLDSIRRCGASAFLPKPFDLDNLLAQVASLLASRPATSVVLPASPASIADPRKSSADDDNAPMRRRAEVNGKPRRPAARRKAIGLDLVGRTKTS